ncbi:MGMT family protein [Paludibacter sp. 221]|uniref:MGMT family protein n=1 Tax=Paludibacter sp. 221 TaxID=2302939 RepID=UPI0013D5E5D0|nr:MGMT family protein [Paludibacter sp. 221]NDV46533.1 MGMT family protein [Paludibacter sp. 221]
MDKEEKEIFRQAVYDIVKTVPYGRATSYGAIAKAIGYPNFSRMVGHIMAECDSANNNIPAHRVVNSAGVLSGKEAFGTSAEMQQLLATEGIVVVNDKIKNWKKVFWNPLEEINISVK